MLRIVRVRITKDQLRKLSAEERSMFFLVGHIANQLAILTKLVAFSSNWRTYGPAEEKATAVQTQMFARYSIGVVFEGWRLISERFLSRPLGREYRGRLGPVGGSALDNLCNYFGQSSILSQARNSFAFHNPRDSEIEAAFEAAPDDGEWDWYLQEKNINTFYLMSDLVITYGILATAGITDPLAAHQKIIEDTQAVSGWIVDFALSFVSAVVEAHFPGTIGEIVEEIANAPNVFGVHLPFYVEVPDVPPTPAAGPS